MEITACVLAFGTRGDVQPVALVAKLLALRGPNLNKVRFVTHAEHRPWLEAEVFGGGVPSSAIQTIFVDTPAMAASPDGAATGEAATGECRPAASSSPSSSSPLWSSAQQRACIEACLGSGGGAAVDVIAFNLFALEVRAAFTLHASVHRIYSPPSHPPWA
jgi:hypothetical protein